MRVISLISIIKKTEIFINTTSAGFISLQIGVERLINDALNHNLKLAIVTTTSFNNVKVILESTLGKGALEIFEVIAAGDIVDKKSQLLIFMIMFLIK